MNEKIFIGSLHWEIDRNLQMEPHNSAEVNQ